MAKKRSKITSLEAQRQQKEWVQEMSDWVRATRVDADALDSKAYELVYGQLTKLREFGSIVMAGLRIPYRTEVAALNKALRDGDITQKGYDRKLAALQQKYASLDSGASAQVLHQATAEHNALLKRALKAMPTKEQMYALKPKDHALYVQITTALRDWEPSAALQLIRDLVIERGHRVVARNLKPTLERMIAEDRSRFEVGGTTWGKFFVELLDQVAQGDEHSRAHALLAEAAPLALQEIKGAIESVSTDKLDKRARMKGTEPNLRTKLIRDPIVDPESDVEPIENRLQALQS